MGRNRKSDKEKVVQGTFRHDRMEPFFPELSGEIAEPPDYLSDKAKQHFFRLLDRLIPMGLAAVEFEAIFSMTASTLAEIEELREFLDENGYSYETKDSRGNTIYKAHPEVAMLSGAMKHAQSLLRDCGLSPKSNVSRKGEKPKKPSKWNSLNGKDD